MAVPALPRNSLALWVLQLAAQSIDLYRAPVLAYTATQGAQSAQHDTGVVGVE
jgi:hypothetical protein